MECIQTAMYQYPVSSPNGQQRLTRMTDDARSSGLRGQGEPLLRYNIGSSVDGEICSVVLTRLKSVSWLSRT